MVEVLEYSFDSADDMNVPVDITLRMDDGCLWHLIASNYMPRKDDVRQGFFEVASADRSELVKIVQDRVLPLYQAAVNQLQSICNGTADHLRYFEEVKLEVEGDDEQ